MKRLTMVVLILLCATLHSATVHAEGGYQVLRGTRVYTEIDHARGVATFSNDCGSQTLTQQQLLQGAYPSNIIPCNKGSGLGGGVTCQSGYEPTRNGKCMPKGSVDCGTGKYCKPGEICTKGDICLNIASGRVCSDMKTYCEEGRECRSGNKCISPNAEKASEYFDLGKQKYEESKYSEAEIAFALASVHYEHANQPNNAETARRNGERAGCYRDAEKYKGQASLLRQLGGSKECSPFAVISSAIKSMADEAERKDKEEQAARESTRKAAAPAPQSASPHQPAQRDEKCSDVSGTGGPRIQCAQPAPSRTQAQSPQPGLRCTGGGDCMAYSKWSRERPYNQGSSAVEFGQFRGLPITIPPGHSLWSIKDEHSPTRRLLVARPWSGNSKTGAPNCAQEGTNATTVDFEVNLQCETDRQLDLQKAFEQREDTYPFIDYNECVSPKTLKMNPGWEKRSPEYWKANPEEPVGWCFIPRRDNREDVRKVREPNWLTPKQCEAFSPVPLSVNKRGIRGCPASSQKY